MYTDTPPPQVLKITAQIYKFSFPIFERSRNMIWWWNYSLEFLWNEKFRCGFYLQIIRQPYPNLELIHISQRSCT